VLSSTRARRNALDYSVTIRDYRVVNEDVGITSEMIDMSKLGSS